MGGLLASACCRKDSQEAELEVKEAKPGDPEFVCDKFDSMDYEEYENQASRVDHGLMHLTMGNINRYVITIIIGVSTGLIGGFIELTNELISCIKFEFLNKRTIGGDAWPALYGYFLLTSLPLALFGSLIVAYIEPTAGGGGISGVMGILNGVRVPRIAKFRVLVIKVISLLMMLNSGMAGGKEGPLVHIGSVLGACIPMMGLRGIYLFKDFHKDSERRDFIAAGFAAGLTAAFGTPIGGMLMVMEDGLTFWSTSITFRIFICGLCSAVTLAIIQSIHIGEPGKLSYSELLFFPAFQQKETTHYELFELPVFCLMGAISGLLGALWITVQKYLILLRIKYINRKYKKVMEVVFICWLTTSMNFLTVTLLDSCSQVKDDWPHSPCAPQPHYNLQLRCKTGFDAWAIFLYQQGNNVLKTTFENDPDFIPMVPMIIFVIMYFLWSVLTMGSAIAAGIFVPNLILGAVGGRLFALIIQTLYPQSVEWATLSKYAFLGAAAQLSGVVRLTFSLGIIMTEASGTTAFAIPIFIMLITNRLVGSLFVQGIYEVDCQMRGIPVLSKNPPPLHLKVEASQVMTKSPVKALPLKPPVGYVQQMLRDCKHNGFPIVESYSKAAAGEPCGKLRGLVLRSELVTILDMMSDTRPDTSSFTAARQRYNSLIPGQFLMESEVLRRAENLSGSLDLARYMNPHPYTVKKNTPLKNIHKLFVDLGLRHIVVITDSNEVVGVITRKDLAIYKQEEKCYGVHIKKVELRPC